MSTPTGPSTATKTGPPVPERQMMTALEPLLCPKHVSWQGHSPGTYGMWVRHTDQQRKAHAHTVTYMHIYLCTSSFTHTHHTYVFIYSYMQTRTHKANPPRKHSDMHKQKKTQQHPQTEIKNENTHQYAHMPVLTSAHTQTHTLTQTYVLQMRAHTHVKDIHAFIDRQ